jgi:VanZ family protein
MATSPALLNPSRVAPGRASGVTSTAWLPAFLCVVFVACTSNGLNSGRHTQVLVDYVWKLFMGSWHDEWTGVINEAARKSAHFFGYGVIGLIFRNAWTSSSRVRRMRILGRWMSGEWMASITTLSVFTAFLVASADEMHQRFVPGRVGCFRDVMVDCAGALMMNAIYWLVRIRRNRIQLEAW